MRNASRLCHLPFIAAVLWFAGETSAAEIRGEVTSASGTSVEIRVAGDLVPRVGDPLTLSFEVPGAGEIPLSGDWRVKSVTGDLVTATAEGKISGKPQAGYSAVIHAKSPQKIAASAPPPPAATSPPIRKKSTAELFRKINLQQFVIEHHQSLVNRDFETLMSHYASKVRWTNKGVRGPDFILKDYQGVLREWPRLEMQVRDPFTIKRTKNRNQRLVTYRLDCNFSNPQTKKEIRRLLEITLTLVARDGRLSVIAEEHRVLERQKIR